MPTFGVAVSLTGYVLSKMSTFYNIDAKEIRRRIDKLCTASKPPSPDPVLGQQPNLVSEWNTFVKKHGRLIEYVLSQSITRSYWWEASPQRKFSTVPSMSDKLIDRIAINRALGVVIFIESKRSVGTIDSKSAKRIIDYDNAVRSSYKAVAKELGLDPADTLVFFAVFNAYGERSDGAKITGIPMLMPADLPKLFPPSVTSNMTSLDAQVSQHAAHVFERDIGPSPMYVDLESGDNSLFPEENHNFVSPNQDKQLTLYGFYDEIEIIRPDKDVEHRGFLREHISSVLSSCTHQ